MRLGDLDDLKAKVALMFGDKTHITESVCELIDNAPTVEPCYQTTSCLDCKMYDKEKHNCPRFCEVIRSAIEERPQGKWIDIDSLVSKAMCSNCKNIIITEPFGKPKTCPNCTADMRGEADRLRDCENCVHHSDNGCEVWECKFEKRSDL